MLHKRKDMTPEEARRALEWLAEMGADEVIAETPVNRLLPRTEPEPSAPPKAIPKTQMLSNGGDARSLADSCESLEDIVAALNQFDACPLKKTATQLCFCDGNPNAEIMLIGEAPGRDEDLQGKPFVGRSGQLLDKMLSCIGLSRHSEDPASSVFITNVIFWRPPGNRTPTEQETAMCLPFLRRAIELLHPRAIVCLGATPTQRLTGRTDGILKLRGKWLDIESGGRRIPLLATLHPAYLLRQPAQKRLAWRDLLALKMFKDKGFHNG
jgi:DNA polymerase